MDMKSFLVLVCVCATIWFSHAAPLQVTEPAGILDESQLIGTDLAVTGEDEDAVNEKFEDETTGRSAPAPIDVEEALLEPHGTFNKTSSTIYYDMTAPRSINGPGALNCQKYGHRIPARVNLKVLNRKAQTVLNATTTPGTLSEFVATQYQFTAYKLSTCICIVLKATGEGWEIPSSGFLDWQASVHIDGPESSLVASEDFGVKGFFELHYRNPKQTVSMGYGVQPTEGKSYSDGPKFVVSDDFVRFFVTTTQRNFTDDQPAQLIAAEMLLPLKHQSPLVPQVVAREPFALRLLLPKVLNHYKVVRYTVEFAGSGSNSYSEPRTGEPGQEFVVNDLAPSSVYLFRVVAFQQGMEPAVYTFEDATDRYVDEYALPSFRIDGQPQIFITMDPTMITCRVPARRSPTAADNERTWVAVRDIKSGDLVKQLTLYGPGDHSIGGLPAKPYLVEINVYDSDGIVDSARKYVKFVPAGPTTRTALPDICPPSASRRDGSSIFLRVCQRKSTYSAKILDLRVTIRNAMTQEIIKADLKMSIGADNVIDGVDTTLPLEIQYSGIDEKSFEIKFTEVIRQQSRDVRLVPGPGIPTIEVGPRQVIVFVPKKKGPMLADMVNSKIRVVNAVTQSLVALVDVFDPKRTIIDVPPSALFVTVQIHTTYTDESVVESAQTFRVPGVNVIDPMPASGPTTLQLIGHGDVANVKVPSESGDIASAAVYVMDQTGTVIHSEAGKSGDFIIPFINGESVMVASTSASGVPTQVTFNLYSSGFEPLFSDEFTVKLMPVIREDSIIVRVTDTGNLDAQTVIAFPRNPLVIPCVPILAIPETFGNHSRLSNSTHNFTTHNSTHHNKTIQSPIGANTTAVPLTCDDEIVYRPPAEYRVVGPGDHAVPIPEYATGVITISRVGHENKTTHLDDVASRIGLDAISESGDLEIYPYGTNALLIRCPASKIAGAPVASAKVLHFDKESTLISQTTIEVGTDTLIHDIDSSVQFQVKAMRTFKDGSLDVKTVTFVPGLPKLNLMPHVGGPIVVPLNPSNLIVRIPKYSNSNSSRCGTANVRLLNSSQAIIAEFPGVCAGDLSIEDLEEGDYVVETTVAQLDGLSKVYTTSVTTSLPELTDNHCPHCSSPMATQSPPQAYLMDSTSLYYQAPASMSSLLQGNVVVKKVIVKVTDANDGVVAHLELTDLPTDGYIDLPENSGSLIVSLVSLFETEQEETRFTIHPMLDGLQPLPVTAPPSVAYLKFPTRVVLRAPRCPSVQLSNIDYCASSVDFTVIEVESGKTEVHTIPAGSDLVLQTSAAIDFSATVHVVDTSYEAITGASISADGPSVHPLPNVGDVHVLPRGPSSLLVRVPRIPVGYSDESKVFHLATDIECRGPKSDTGLDHTVYGQYSFSGAGDHSIYGMPSSTAFYMDVTVTHSAGHYTRTFFVKSAIFIPFRHDGDPEVHADRKDPRLMKLAIPAQKAGGPAEVAIDVMSVEHQELLQSLTFSNEHAQAPRDIIVPSATDLIVSMHATWADGTTHLLVNELTMPVNREDNLNREVPRVVGGGVYSVTVYIPDRRGPKKVQSIDVSVYLVNSAKHLVSQHRDDPSPGDWVIRGLPSQQKVRVTVTSRTVGGMRLFNAREVQLLAPPKEYAPGSRPTRVSSKTESGITLDFSRPLPNGVKKTMAYALNINDASDYVAGNTTDTGYIFDLKQGAQYQVFMVTFFQKLGDISAECAWITSNTPPSKSKSMVFMQSATEVFISLPGKTNTFKVYRLDQESDGRIAAIRLVYSGKGEASITGVNGYVSRTLVPGRRYKFRVDTFDSSGNLVNTRLLDQYTDRKFGSCDRGSWYSAPTQTLSISPMTGIVQTIPVGNTTSTPAMADFSGGSPIPIQMKKPKVSLGAKRVVIEWVRLEVAPPFPITNTIIEMVMRGPKDQPLAGAVFELVDVVDESLSSYEVPFDKLVPGYKYVFTVSGQNEIMTGKRSAESDILIPITSPRRIQIPTFTGTSATTVMIQWHAPFAGIDDINSYSVECSPGYRTTNYSCQASSEYTTLWNGDGLVASLTGLYPATKYSCRVRAESTHAGGTTSDIGTFTTLALVPDMVLNVTVFEIGPNSLEVTYSKPPHNGLPIMFYMVEMVEDGIAFAGWKSVCQNMVGNTCLVNGLRQDTLYKFRVFATNAKGPGPFSETVMGRTVRATLPKPTFFEAVEITATSLTLRWKRNGGENTKYRVSCGSPKPCDETTFNPVSTGACENFDLDGQSDQDMYDCCNFNMTEATELALKEDELMDWWKASNFWKRLLTHDDQLTRSTCSQELWGSKCLNSNLEFAPSSATWKALCEVCGRCVAPTKDSFGKKLYGKCDWALPNQPKLVDYTEVVYEGKSGITIVDNLEPSTAYKCFLEAIDSSMNSGFAIGSEDKEYTVFRTASDIPAPPPQFSVEISKAHVEEFGDCADIPNFATESQTPIETVLECSTEDATYGALKLTTSDVSPIEVVSLDITVTPGQVYELTGEVRALGLLCNDTLEDDWHCNGAILICEGPEISVLVPTPTPAPTPTPIDIMANSNSTGNSTFSNTTFSNATNRNMTTNNTSIDEGIVLLEVGQGVEVPARAPCMISRRNTTKFEPLKMKFEARNTTIRIIAVSFTNDVNFRGETILKNLTLSSGPESIHVKWDEPNGHGLPIDDYVLERKIVKKPDDHGLTGVWEVLTVSDARDYSIGDSDLLPDHEYQFRVSAITAISASTVSYHINSTDAEHVGFSSVHTPAVKMPAAMLKVMKGVQSTLICDVPGHKIGNDSNLMSFFWVREDMSSPWIESNGTAPATFEAKCQIVNLEFPSMSSEESAVVVVGSENHGPLGSSTAFPFEVHYTNMTINGFSAQFKLSGLHPGLRDKLARCRLDFGSPLATSSDAYSKQMPCRGAGGVATSIVCKTTDSDALGEVLQFKPEVSPVGDAVIDVLVGGDRSQIDSELFVVGSKYPVRAKCYIPEVGWSVYTEPIDFFGPTALPLAVSTPSLKSTARGIAIYWAPSTVETIKYLVKRVCVSGTCTQEEPCATYETQGDEEKEEQKCSAFHQSIVCEKDLAVNGVGTEIKANDDPESVETTFVPYFPSPFCEDPTVMTGSVYSYSVTAVGLSGPVEGAPNDVTASLGMSHDFNLTSTSLTSTSIRLKWTDVDPEVLTQYLIRWHCTFGCGEDGLVTTEGSQSTTETYSEITGLRGGGRMYLVTIMAAIENKLVQEQKYFTLPADLPARPGHMYFEQYPGGKVNAFWGACPELNGGQTLRYRLEYSADNGATWDLPGTTRIEGTNFTVSGLTPRLGYIFRVQVRNYLPGTGCQQPGVKCGPSEWTYSEVVTIMSACGNTLGLVCSNHGTCKEDTATCVCDPIWQGKDCQREVRIMTAHAVGAGHLLYSEYPTNVYRSGEFVLYHNPMTGERIHGVYGVHRGSRTSPNFHAMTKISLVFDNNRISIESKNASCPTLRQNCVPLISIEQQPFATQGVPLTFEPSEDPVTNEDCEHLRIKNDKTGTTIECHQWYQGFMSCHLTFRVGEGVEGLIFEREYSQSESVMSIYPTVESASSVFFEPLKGAPCASPISALELSTTVRGISGSGSVLAPADQSPVMGQLLSEAALGLKLGDVDGAVAERQVGVESVLSGSVFVGPRTVSCGVMAENATNYCTGLFNTPLHSTCMEDLCIPEDAALPVTLTTVANRDLALLQRVVQAAKDAVSDAVALSHTASETRLANGDADDPSMTVNKVLGTEWFNQCPARGMFAVTSDAVKRYQGLSQDQTQT